MTEPARKATFERGLEARLRRLRRAHVRADGDVHADEAGGGREHGADQEADRRAPAELVVEAEQQERDDRDDARSSCTAAAGTPRRPPGSRARSPASARVPAGCWSSHHVNPSPKPIATAQQTSANTTAWSLKKSILARSRHKVRRRQASARGSFLSQASGRADRYSTGPRGGCVRVRELEVRHHLPQVAERAPPARTLEHGKRAPAAPRSRAAPGRDRGLRLVELRVRRAARASSTRGERSGRRPQPLDLLEQLLGVRSNSGSDRLDHLLGVDLAQRRALLEPRELAFSAEFAAGTASGHAELLGDGRDPLDELLERGARRPHVAASRGRSARPTGRSGSRARSSPRSGGAGGPAAARPRRARARSGR